MTRWSADPSFVAMTLPLLVAGLGFGLVIAPINTAVLATPTSDRATVASLLTVVRLLGALVGVALLTTRGLGGFYAEAGLIPLDDPRFVDLVQRPRGRPSATFLVTAAVCFATILPALLLGRRNARSDVSSQVDSPSVSLPFLSATAIILAMAEDSLASRRAGSLVNPPRHSAAPPALRPPRRCGRSQWTKNGIVFMALHLLRQPGLAAGQARHLGPPAWSAPLLTALVFCVVSGADYLVNDVRDRESDRLHPTKRRRPIAAGLLAPKAALAWAAVALRPSASPSPSLIDWRTGAVVVGYIAPDARLLFLPQVPGHPRRHGHRCRLRPAGDGRRLRHRRADLALALRRHRPRRAVPRRSPSAAPRSTCCRATPPTTARPWRCTRRRCSTR